MQAGFPLSEMLKTRSISDLGVFFYFRAFWILDFCIRDTQPVMKIRNDGPFCFDE